MKCIQCGSQWCGPIVCRFTSVRHEIYRWNQAMDLVEHDLQMRHEGRPEHDMTCSGLPLKAGS
jgi:hypothetical protein